ncbi:hypothetical protein M2128_000120 [Polynucleobacter sphagniphilus]|uniref:hypothetical protein n=1 Tax=Polynucleobacter sphagniphilus TaxID=1743169 RepID=UPI002476D80B|nr:hypothetical protein [Polynucleobacter sphagniphilus]MDH6301218.1 hypothetical protein [Polynucleobacter sphagniphilus]
MTNSENGKMPKKIDSPTEKMLQCAKFNQLRREDALAELWLAKTSDPFATQEEIEKRVRVALIDFSKGSHRFDWREAQDRSESPSDPLEILEKAEESRKNEAILRKNRHSFPALVALLDFPEATTQEAIAKRIGKRKEFVAREISRELAEFENAKAGKKIQSPLGLFGEEKN